MTKQRTGQQNNAMHKYFELLSEALNDAGYNVMQTMKHDAEIPWNARLVKELIWRPVQIAAHDIESTAKLNKLQVSDVYETVNRHLADKVGVSVAFPCESDMSEYEGW